MKKLFNLFKIKQIQLDDRIIWGILHKCWGFISGPVTTLIIIFYLNQEFQGYFYTFMQIAALSQISDMGLNTIFLFIIGKKYSVFKNDNTDLDNLESTSAGELRSILSLMYRYLLIIPFIAFPLVYFSGVFFFNIEESVNIQWELAWLLLSAVVAFDVASSFLIAHLEALNKVKLSNQLKLLKAMITSLTLWVLLTNNYKLLSLPISLSFGTIVFLCIYLYLFRYTIMSVVSNKQKLTISWKNDIWPFQWRMAITWIFGSYILNNMSIIVVFYFLGPIKAGMFGLTFAVSEIILHTSHIWMETITPKITFLVSDRKDNQAKDLLRSRLFQAIVVTFILGVFFFIALFIIKLNFNNIYIRFMPLYTIPVILLAGIFRHVIHAQTIFIRAHQKENMMPSYVVAGISSLVFSIILVPQFDLLGICLSILLVKTIIQLPTSSYIYYNFIRTNK